MMLFSQLFLGLSSLCCNLIIIIFYILTHNWGFVSSTIVSLSSSLLGWTHKLFLLVAVPINEIANILLDVDLLADFFKYLTFSAISGIGGVISMILLFGRVNLITALFFVLFGSLVAAIDGAGQNEDGFEIGERLE